jgi:ribosomal-protein-serine acetyltransferase
MFTYKIDDQIRLELPEPRHAETAARVVRENLEHLGPWMPWAVDDYDVEHAKQWIQRTLDEFAHDGRFNALILSDDAMIGTVGFHDLDTANRHAAIGYWIDYRHQGKGIITRCCRVLIDHLFNTMNLNRVQINCNVENERSRAVPERLGFSLEGTLREVELVDGRFGDWAVYGLLRSEWQRMPMR